MRISPLEPSLFKFANSFSEASIPFYPPSDDTFLFLDVLHKEELEDTECAKKNSKSSFFNKVSLGLEIGPGSGALTAFLGSKIGGMMLGVDINLEACQATRHTCANVRSRIKGGEEGEGRRDDLLFDVVCADLTRASPFRGVEKGMESDEDSGDGGKGIFEVIICNPPYVPSPVEELTNFRDEDFEEARSGYLKLKNQETQEGRKIPSFGIELAWAGGDEGRMVIDRFMPKVWNLLRRRGRGEREEDPSSRFYLLLEAQNRPAEVRKNAEKIGYKNWNLVGEKRCMGERLGIYRMEK